jgi:purine-binding chemotaxis protein CheW
MAAGAGETVQAVTFAIGKEQFAVPVPFVREILDYCEPFAIPNAPAHFVGLIDVREQGVPTVDLRLRLGLPRAEPTPHTRILVLELPYGTRTLVIGLVIDRALSVSAFAPDEIDTSPEIGMQWNSDYIRGVVRRDGGFTVLIDIARIITGEDAALLGRDWPQAA